MNHTTGIRAGRGATIDPNGGGGGANGGTGGGEGNG